MEIVVALFISAVIVGALWGCIESAVFERRLDKLLAGGASADEVMGAIQKFNRKGNRDA